MNVERWVRTRRPAWQKLEELLHSIERRSMSGLKRDELRELGRLYRSASADLSRVRALNLSGDLSVYLNNLVVKAHNQVYQRRLNRWSEIFHFLWISFPRLVRENILYIMVSVFLFTAPLAVSYFMVLNDVDFAHLEVVKGQPLVSEELWHIIEQHKMWTDSAQDYSPAISGLIAANNIRVAILAFSLGITLGFGTVWVLLTNGMSIGTIFGVCKVYGLHYNLLSFVASHGVLELTSIFISGGAGLMLAKGLLFPGQLRRGDSLRRAAKISIGLFGGCIPLLLIAGLIEGFISPRTDLPAQAKYLISMATALCLMFYLFVPRRPFRDEPGT
jgi:uncharacterized membrane protein SpoIIM required for sporulation